MAGLRVDQGYWPKVRTDVVNVGDDVVCLFTTATAPYVSAKAW